MKWKFWQKDDEKVSDKIENLNNKVLQLVESNEQEVEKLTNKIEVLEEKLDKLNVSSKQMNRLQYKNNKEIISKLEEQTQKIEKQSAKKELLEKLENNIIDLNTKVEYSSQQLIDFIDEFDLIKRGLAADEERWSTLLAKWSSRMLKLLEKNGIDQLNLAGKEFNPRLAEAISRVNAADVKAAESTKNEIEYSDNQIVEIIKRGYKDQDDKVIRKALVIVYREVNND